MNPSLYDGQKILYIDALKLTHTGAVVGQTADGKWLFVQSDNPNVPPAAWHFKIAASKIQAYLNPN